jgi:uncharacterized protein (DUF1697 family)
VRERLRRLLGEEPLLMLRTMRELERIVARAPFAAVASEPDIKLYVVFLEKKPARRPDGPLTSSKERLEVLAIDGREVYLLSRRKESGFYGFPNSFVEAALGVRATSRNWSTVTRIAAASVAVGPVRRAARPRLGA